MSMELSPLRGGGSTIEDTQEKINSIKIYVIEEGSDQGWKYRKFNNGEYELRITYTTTLNHYSVFNGWYGYDTYITLPFDMELFEDSNFSCQIGNGFALPALAPKVYNNTSLRVLAISSDGRDQCSCTFHIYLHGIRK